MEADEYFSTYDAIHDEATPPTRLVLNVQESCGISKILWSSFDYMSGPELRFVWEIGTSKSISPVDLSADDCSITDAESLNSSVSQQSGNFEDIDDPLQFELSTVDEMMDSMLLSDSAIHYFSKQDEDGTEHYLEDFMTESRSTTTMTNTTFGSSSPTLEIPGSTDELSIPSKNSSSSGNTTMASPDVCFGTPTTSQQLNSLLSPETQEDDVKKDMESSCTTTTESSFIKLNETEEEKEQHQMLTSFVDSGIAGTISTHSDLSALCQSPLRPPTGEEDYPDYLLDIPFDYSDDPVSDEAFVAKFVLAEQICSTQLSSNPLMLKLTLIPSRRILVTSFIFSLDDRTGRQHLHSLSFIYDDRRMDWFMTRQNFFEGFMTDAVPRIKASLHVEEWDDVIVRTTSELTYLTNLLGLMDRFPLYSPQRTLMIKNTLLCSRKCADDKLLQKVISGCLQSQGHCVVIGSNHQYVAKLLNTLALFVPDEWKWCCLRSFRSRYSPHVRVQAVRRSELPNVIQLGALSSWPVCVVDVDRSTVGLSASYNRHRTVRQRAEVERIQSILNAGQFPIKNVRLEITPCRTLECVKLFLKNLDLLPMEESPRIGFIAQLLLYVENMALAFIQYVRETSLPHHSEKENPLKSKKFSLSDCRRALDLQSDAWFNAVLAKAELLQPDIADFLYLP